MMRRFLLLLGFSTITSCSYGAIAFVQSASTFTATSAISTSTAFTSNTTSGNTITVCTSWGDVTKTMAITDSELNVYASTGSFTTNSGLDRYQIFWSTNIVGGSKDRVRATINSGTSNIDLIIHEYSGGANGSTLTSIYDVASTTFSVGVGTALTSGNFTTTNANDLVFACGFSGNSVSAIQAGWTKRVSENGNMSGDKIFTVTITTAAKFTASSGSWSDAAVAFLPSTVSSPRIPLIRGLSITGRKVSIVGGRVIVQ